MEPMKGEDMRDAQRTKSGPQGFVSRCRRLGEGYANNPLMPVVSDYLIEAADTIEFLQAEVERLRAQLTGSCVCMASGGLAECPVHPGVSA